MQQHKKNNRKWRLHSGNTTRGNYTIPTIYQKSGLRESHGWNSCVCKSAQHSPLPFFSLFIPPTSCPKPYIFLKSHFPKRAGFGNDLCFFFAFSSSNGFDTTH